jgi:transposase InsO family protein
MREELGQRPFLRWPMWFDVQGFEHTNDWLDILWRLFADWLRWALEGGNTPLFVRTAAEAGRHTWIEHNTRRPHSALGYRPPAPAAYSPLVTPRPVSQPGAVM